MEKMLFLCNLTNLHGSFLFQIIIYYDDPCEGGGGGGGVKIWLIKLSFIISDYNPLSIN